MGVGAVATVDPRAEVTAIEAVMCPIAVVIEAVNVAIIKDDAETVTVSRLIIGEGTGHHRLRLPRHLVAGVIVDDLLGVKEIEMLDFLEKSSDRGLNSPGYMSLPFLNLIFLSLIIIPILG